MVSNAPLPLLTFSSSSKTGAPVVRHRKSASSKKSAASRGGRISKGAAEPSTERYCLIENPVWQGLEARREQERKVRDLEAIPAPCQALRPATPQKARPSGHSMRHDASLNASHAHRSSDHEGLAKAGGAVLEQEPHSGLGQMLQTFVQLFQPAEAQRPVTEPVAYNATDQEVRKRLEEVNSKARLQDFQEAWRRLRHSPYDPTARKALAEIYSHLMYANRLTESDQEKFHHCIELGRRSVELDPNCCSAFEQLGIAYSIVQAPLAEAKRCVDQTVYLGGLTELATKSHDPAHAQRSEHFEPSADFYFVYWRLFRGDPSRRRQVDWALRRYESAQPKQRSFDAKLRDLQLLERQSALFS